MKNSKQLDNSAMNEDNNEINSTGLQLHASMSVGQREGKAVVGVGNEQLQLHHQQPGSGYWPYWQVGNNYIVDGGGLNQLSHHHHLHTAAQSREYRRKQRRNRRLYGAQRPSLPVPLPHHQPPAPPLPPQPRVINPMWMMFLFEKELQNSDVGTGGRIVVPKRMAELHLPILNDKDGFSIEFEDMSYQIVWTFKYRFWPNNSSRIYVLENAKEFVKLHNLDYGDFFMVFRDTQTGAFFVQGRKKEKEDEEVMNHDAMKMQEEDYSSVKFPALEEHAAAAAASQVYRPEPYIPESVDYFVDNTTTVDQAGMDLPGIQRNLSFESLDFDIDIDIDDIDDFFS